MGFVRKLTGVQGQIDATNANTDSQVQAAKQAADAQVQALNASAKAATDAARMAADRERAAGAAADAASKPLAVADVALDAGAAESVVAGRRSRRAQFGKNYSSGVSI